MINDGTKEKLIEEFDLSDSTEPNGQANGDDIELRSHRDRNVTTRKWIVKKFIPQDGHGLLAGQSQIGKTATLVDLAAGLSAKTRNGPATFAGLPIRIRGVMLIFALEGGDTIDQFVEAVSKEKYGGQVIPIWYTSEQVRLLDKNGLARIMQIIEKAKIVSRECWSLPLVAVCFDTMMKAAGYLNEGAEQDNVITNRAMQALEKIAKETGLLVIGTDHFGKDQTKGLRGASAKYDSADFVLYLYGDRQPDGTITNRSINLNKLRGGRPGASYPFDVREIDIGEDEDGDSVSGAIIDWNVAPRLAPKASGKKPNKIARIVADLVNDGYGEIRSPRTDMKPVKCIKLDDVRKGFYRTYVGRGDATDQKKLYEAKYQAARRAIQAAADANAIGLLDDWCWLT
jgi:AAA domain